MTQTGTQTQAKHPLIEHAHDVLVPAFPIQPFIAKEAEGCYIYDENGKKHLDFAAGIAVMSLGHKHPAYVNAAKAQLDKIVMCVGSYVTEERIACADLILDNCCMEQIFFTNSGTEAIEGLIKLTRKWAYDTKGEDCNEIIAFQGSFHGRSMGSASLTAKCHKQPFFGPYLPGVNFAEFNNLESVKALATDRTAAIFVEPVQGESGITPADKEFLNGLRALCDEHNIALVFDEIQAGMGRMGTLMAHKHFDVEPDAIALAKGMGGGFPVGAFLAKKKFSDHLTVGTHGTTYGGSPLATSIAHAVISEMLSPGFLENVKEISAYMMSELEKLKTKTNKITDIRGEGLMIGVDTVFDIKKLLPALRDAGLLATQAGLNTLRLTPPLIIGKAEVDEAIEIMNDVMSKEAP